MDYLALTASQLGAILRGFRRQRRLTQAALGERLGLPQKVISLAELHPDRLGVDRLLAILGALGVELVLRDPGAPRSRATTEW